MSSLQQLFTSRKPYNASTYVAGKGKLFYNELTGQLRLGDGHTAGGVSIAVTTNIVTTESIIPEADNIYGIGTELLRWNHLHLGDGGIYFDGSGYPYPQIVPYLPSALTGSLVPATDNGVNLGNTNHRFANLYLGYAGLYLADQTTDANINITVNSGTLYVAGAANLAIGNLVIRDTTLQSLTTNLDISIGEINDTGFFYIKRKAQFDNVSFGSTEAMVSMNASGGADPATVFPDTVLQTVSRPNKNSRVIQRSYGSTGVVGGDNSYAVWGSYAARGNTASPAALKANDILMRLSGNGYGTTTWGNGGARIEYLALENFTDSAKGTKINFWTTPSGQIASQNVASIDSTGVVSAGIKFTNDNSLQTTAGIPLSAKAVSSATYVATLGIDGKLDATQIPSALTGAIVFKGVWNAATNSPTLSDSLPAGLSTGWEYIVEVGGTRDIGDGSKTFLAGDFVIYDGTHWKQVPSGNAFVSLTGGGHVTVNQSTGAIVLGSDATPNATTSTIVSRDASGNFSANVITANLTGAVTGSVSGNAGSVTNGVYTTGGQTIDGIKTFTSTIQGTITSATLAASVVGGVGVYTLTAGTGTAVSASSGTVTVWNTTPAFNTGTLVTQSVTAQSASTSTSAATAYALANTSTTYVGRASLADSATTATSAATAYSLANTSTTYVGRASLADSATTSTNAKIATTATNLAAATSILAGSLSVDPPAMAGKNVSVVGTYTISGLTTSHKVIVMPQSALPDNFNIGGAWASSTSTLSINFQSYAATVDAAAFTIAYFAWI